MVPRFQLNININNQRQGKTVLSFLPVLLAECDLARRRCGGRAKYAAGQPAAASHQQQPRPALVSSLTSPHQHLHSTVVPSYYMRGY